MRRLAALTEREPDAADPQGREVSDAIGDVQDGMSDLADLLRDAEARADRAVTVMGDLSADERGAATLVGEVEEVGKLVSQAEIDFEGLREKSKEVSRLASAPEPPEESAARRGTVGGMRRLATLAEVVGSADAMWIADKVREHFTLNPSGQLYLDALTGPEVAAYGEKGITTQVLYIYGNIRPRTPKGKALKKLLLQYGQDKITFQQLRDREAQIAEGLDALERTESDLEAGMRRLSSLQERAATTRRPTADPKWMQDALKISDLHIATWDALGLRGKPSGDEEVASRVLFLKKMEQAFGPPRKQVPIEVYYELEDANYHTANEILDKAGYFDATYGERQDAWERERQGIKPMWDR